MTAPGAARLVLMSELHGITENQTFRIVQKTQKFNGVLRVLIEDEESGRRYHIDLDNRVKILRAENLGAPV